MHNLFVPYSLAMEVKDKGFDDHCLAFYQSPFDDKDEDVTFVIGGTKTQDYHSRQLCSAPTYQQVFSWLRGKNIDVSILPNTESYEYYFIIHVKPTEEYISNMKEVHKHCDPVRMPLGGVMYDSETYEAASCNAIRRALTLV